MNSGVADLKESDRQRPVRIVLLADKKDHGPDGNGLHDYPLWQERWALLLGGCAASGASQVNLYGPPVGDVHASDGAQGVTVERAWNWPNDAQFAAAGVIVAFCYLPWSPPRKEQMRAYLARGGGVVLIHSATWTLPKADPEVAALVGIGGFTRYRHGDVRLETVGSGHPVCRDLPPALLLKDDEIYWPPTPIASSNMTVLAVSRERMGVDDGAGMTQPAMWVYTLGRGRVFGCVPGHAAWTFDDPAFRLWLLRGIAWAADVSPYRFDSLALRGARACRSEVLPRH